MFMLQPGRLQRMVEPTKAYRYPASIFGSRLFGPFYAAYSAWKTHSMLY